MLVIYILVLIVIIVAGGLGIYIINDYKSQMKGIRKEIDEAEDDVSYIATEASKIIGTNENELIDATATLQKIEHDLTALRGKSDILKNQISMIDKEMEQAKENEDKLLKAAGSIYWLTPEIEKQAAQMGFLSQESDQVQEEINRITGLHSELNMYIHSLKGFETLYSDNYLTHSNTLNNLESRNEELTGNISVLRSNVDGLKTSLGSFQTYSSTISSAESNFLAYKRVLTDPKISQSKIQELQTNVRGYDTRFDSMLGEYARLDTNITSNMSILQRNLGSMSNTLQQFKTLEGTMSNIVRLAPGVQTDIRDLPMHNSNISNQIQQVAAYKLRATTMLQGASNLISRIDEANNRVNAANAIQTNIGTVRGRLNSVLEAHSNNMSTFTTDRLCIEDVCITQQELQNALRLARLSPSPSPTPRPFKILMPNGTQGWGLKPVPKQPFVSYQTSDNINLIHLVSIEQATTFVTYSDPNLPGTNRGMVAIKETSTGNIVVIQFNQLTLMDKPPSTRHPATFNLVESGENRYQIERDRQQIMYVDQVEPTNVMFQAIGDGSAFIWTFLYV